MSKLLNVSSSPHVRSHETTHSIMLDVAIAMLPATAFGVYHFGMHALLVLIVTVAACVLSEYVYEKLMKKQSTVSDCSALVTGLILALNMPPEIPVWIPALGGIFAIIVVKQLYGGLGRNFMNPALAGRMLLTTFPGIMTNWVDAFQHPGLLSTADAVTSATPMSYLHNGQLPPQSVGQLLMGQHGGAMGSVAVMMLILGGLYLVARRVIQPRAPLAFLATVALLTLLFPQGDGGRVAWMLAQLFSGGLMLGAIFMASAYTTTPVTPRGQVLFGVGCGLLTVLLRYFGSYPDGVGWAILTMNCCVWLLDRTGMPRRFGVGRFAATREQITQVRASLAEIKFVKPQLRLLSRAGEGTMPGEGYLDELRLKVRQWGVLAVAVALMAGMVFGVHQLTDFATVRTETKLQQELLSQVMPQATTRTETPFRASGALSITAGYNNDGLVGYCVEVQAHGFGGLMTAVVGVNTNGEVTGVAITSHNETLSTGTQALESEYLNQYKGKSGTIRSSGSNAVDTISGATATCDAVTDCVNQALSIVANLDTEGVEYVDGEV